MPDQSYPKFTPEQMAAALKESRGFVARTARSLGCALHTVYNYIDKYPEVREALTEARESMKDIGEAALFKAVSEGEGWAVCFYLKCQAKDRGYIERQEIQHSGAIPVKHIVLEDEAKPEAASGSPG